MFCSRVFVFLELYMSVGPVQATRSFWQTPCFAPVRWVSDKIAAVAKAIFIYLASFIFFYFGGRDSPDLPPRFPQSNILEREALGRARG